MKLKRIFLYLRGKYFFYNSTRAFNKRYKNVEKKLFDVKVGKDIIEGYRTKWNVFGEKVEIKTFMLCYNLSGKIDYNIVPENLFVSVIEKKLNPYKELSFFSIKNMYEKWFSNKDVFPLSYFHKIDGIFYDKDFYIIEDIENFIQNNKFEFPLILKPSKDTYGGANVRKIINLDELKEGLSEFDNLVCQEFIIQNNDLSLVNDSSVNSVRSCLYRTSSGKFKVINNSMRFGINGGLDNETSGGIVCNIHENGQLNDYAVNKYAVKYFKHPNSNIEFSKVRVPFYENLNLIAEEIANQIPLCNLVSLDMCLDINNNWRCIELNLIGQTIRFAQYAGKAFFGIYTNEVIEKSINPHNFISN